MWDTSVIGGTVPHLVIVRVMTSIEYCCIIAVFKLIMQCTCIKFGMWGCTLEILDSGNSIMYGLALYFDVIVCIVLLQV